jgi:hypothetical protein
MLALPEEGLARSINVHNGKLSVLCDWIEASILFSDEEISTTDVVDGLIENQIYDKQDFANERVEQAWSVIADRITYMKFPLGIKVSKNRISRKQPWSRFPAYGFCMALACSALYPQWARAWDTPASLQGSYFEELAAEAISMTLGGWKIKRLGWAPNNPVKLCDVIYDIISELNAKEGAELDVHVGRHTNELGLDLLAYQSYGDNHASLPILLIQCASGKNWVDKRQSPDLAIWNAIISFGSRPVRGFVMPFAFADQIEFRREATSVDGVFVDRNRLLGAFPRNANKVSAPLNKKLLDWTRQQIRALPKDTA